MSVKLSNSPAAMLVAGLALVVAVGGSAYAAGTINGKSIKNHSITGKKLKPDTLGGAQVDESQLGSVPNAAAAGHAASADHATDAGTVGGFTVRKVYYAPPTATATETTILQLGGLVLSSTCAGGAVSILARSTAEHANLHSELWKSAGGGTAGGLHYSDFGATLASAYHVATLDEGNAWGETSFTYTRANGIIVDGQLSWESTNLNTSNPGDNDIFDHTAACLVSGFVTSTTASP